MSPRILPEEAYDFWVWDRRDGEHSPPRDTYAEAEKDRARLALQIMPWNRACLEVQWAVNESKVLRMLERATRGERKGT